jgi:hypothetical protein
MAHDIVGPGGNGLDSLNMLSFSQFLEQAARKGEVVNTLFEERLFDLVDILQRAATALASEEIPYQVVGGLAVLIHVEEADPEHATLTRDVDLMVRRGDLERIKDAALRAGFRFRHAAGIDMLVFGTTVSARNAVHLVFSGEKVRTDYLVPTPEIMPERKKVHGAEVMVIPVPDLLRMKLTSFRDKDRVHVRALDAAGLIKPDVEAQLISELASRLQRIRETE